MMVCLVLSTLNSLVVPMVYSQSVRMRSTDSLQLINCKIWSKIALLPVNAHKTKGCIKKVESLKWVSIGYSISTHENSFSFIL